MVSNDQIQQMVDVIVEKFHPQSVYLFGSYARGEANDDSDLDLLVLMDPPFFRRKRINEIRTALYKFHVPADVQVFQPETVARFEKVPGSLFYQIKDEKKNVYQKPY